MKQRCPWLNPPKPLAGYASWRQVSGYFDGDGNVGIEVVKRVLRFRIRLVDTWKGQVESIWQFLRSHGIHASSVGRDEKERWQAACRLDVTEIRSVMRAARAMPNFTVKERRPSHNNRVPRRQDIWKRGD